MKFTMAFVLALLALSPVFAQDKKDDKSLVVDKEKKAIRIAELTRLP